MITFSVVRVPSTERVYWSWRVTFGKLSIGFNLDASQMATLQGVIWNTGRHGTEVSFQADAFCPPLPVNGGTTEHGYIDVVKALSTEKPVD